MFLKVLKEEEQRLAEELGDMASGQSHEASEATPTTKGESEGSSSAAAATGGTPMWAMPTPVSTLLSPSGLVFQKSAHPIG